MSGLQVLDEAEFLRFFHRLLQRPDLNELFEKVSHKYKGERLWFCKLSSFVNKILFSLYKLLLCCCRGRFPSLQREFSTVLLNDPASPNSNLGPLPQKSDALPISRHPHLQDISTKLKIFYHQLIKWQIIYDFQAWPSRPTSCSSSWRTFRARDGRPLIKTHMLWRKMSEVTEQKIRVFPNHVFARSIEKESDRRNGKGRS